MTDITLSIVCTVIAVLAFTRARSVSAQSVSFIFALLALLFYTNIKLTRIYNAVSRGTIDSSNHHTGDLRSER